MSTSLFASEAYIQCKVCGASFTDDDTTENNYQGIVSFGPNMLDGVVNEDMLDGYAIVAVDDCGYIQTDAGVLGSIAKSGSSPTCCDNSMYQVNITMANPSYHKIMVVPSGLPLGATNFLDAGVVIDLVDNKASLNDGSASGSMMTQLAPAALALLPLPLVFN